MRHDHTDTHSNKILFMSKVKNFFLPSSSNCLEACNKEITWNKIRTNSVSEIWWETRWGSYCTQIFNAFDQWGGETFGKRVRTHHLRSTVQTSLVHCPQPRTCAHQSVLGLRCRVQSAEVQVVQQILQLALIGRGEQWHHRRVRGQVAEQGVTVEELCAVSRD